MQKRGHLRQVFLDLHYLTSLFFVLYFLLTTFMKLTKYLINTKRKLEAAADAKEAVDVQTENLLTKKSK